MSNILEKDTSHNVQIRCRCQYVQDMFRSKYPDHISQPSAGTISKVVERYENGESYLLPCAGGRKRKGNSWYFPVRTVLIVLSPGQENTSKSSKKGRALEAVKAKVELEAYLAIRAKAEADARAKCSKASDSSEPADFRVIGTGKG